jgi:hypothetical protein
MMMYIVKHHGSHYHIPRSGYQSIGYRRYPVDHFRQSLREQAVYLSGALQGMELATS